MLLRAFLVAAGYVASDLLGDPLAIVWFRLVGSDLGSALSNHLVLLVLLRFTLVAFPVVFSHGCIVALLCWNVFCS